MGKSIAASRTSSWRRLETASNSQLRSFRTRAARLHGSWVRCKIDPGGAKTHLRGTIMTSNPSCSVNEPASSYKHGFRWNIRNHSWRETSTQVARGIKRCGSRCSHSEKSSESYGARMSGEKTRRRRSAVRRVSLPRLMSLAERTDVPSGSQKLTSSKHSGGSHSESRSSQLNSWEFDFYDEHLGVDRWISHENDHGKTHSRKPNLLNEAQPCKVLASLVDMQRQHLRESQVLSRHGDGRKLSVWDFACALAHAYLHQTDSLIGGRRAELKMAGPNVGCVEVCEVEPREENEVRMDDVVNPTQAASWFGASMRW